MRGEKEKIVIFGAGRKGKIAAATLKYEKEIVGIIDNDEKKWGKQFEGYKIYSLKEIKECFGKNIQTVIAIVAYPEIVLQLEKNEMFNYVYFEDIYANDYPCKSREIMDEIFIDGLVGQYTGRYIKNSWMNHVRSPYGEEIYDGIPLNGKILDVGCGCGTALFHSLCLGFDAYGIECCKWKLDFCNQKIDDFDFPKEWKEHIIEGIGEKLPYDEETFDAVTCHMVLEHVDDWRKCIQEMLRVTKIGGIIRIMAPDYRNFYEEHYGIYFGKPLIDHREEFKQFLEENNLETDTFNELNFISKLDILSELRNNASYKLVIRDLDEEYPESRVIRQDNRLLYRRRSDFIIKKEKVKGW